MITYLEKPSESKTQCDKKIRGLATLYGKLTTMYFHTPVIKNRVYSESYDMPNDGKY